MIRNIFYYYIILPDNLSLQDHQSRFIPVRPIVRSTYLHDDLHSDHHLSHTTIGVVIPTTPSQPPQPQQQDDPIWQHLISPISRQRPGGAPATSSTASGVHPSEARSFRIIPDGAPSQPTSSRHSTSSRGSSVHRLTGGVNSAANRQLDDRIIEIQDYIRATSSLINTINQEKVRKVFLIVITSSFPYPLLWKLISNHHKLSLRL